MGSLELIINLIIIGLLIPTIIYAYRLNKNLTILRQNQSSLAKLVSALNDATFKAENSIPKLKSVTEHSSNDLKEVVDSAKELKDDLMFINERADNLADRLEGVIKNSRGVNKDNSAGFKSSAQVLESAFNDSPIPDEKEKPTFSIEDSKSEAEMELLKALRAIK